MLHQAGMTPGLFCKGQNNFLQNKMVPFLIVLLFPFCSIQLYLHSIRGDRGGFQEPKA